MSKLFGSSKIKIAAVASLAIFSLLSVCTATFAWFTSMRKFDNGQGDVPIHDSQYIEKVIVRPFKEGYREVDGILTFDTKAEAADLGHYSILEGNSECVIEVFLTEYGKSLSKIKLSVSTKTEHYLGERDSEGRPYNLIKEEHNPLSSVIDFTVFTENDWVNYDVAIYNFFTIDRNALAPRTKTLVNDNGTMTSSVVLDDGFVATNNHFFVLLNYNEIRINEIYAANLGNPVCSGEVDYVSYDTDFTFLVSEGE